MLKHLVTTSLTIGTLLLGAGQALAASFFIDTFNTSSVGTSAPGTPRDSGTIGILPSQRQPNQDIWLGGSPSSPAFGPTPPRTGPNPYLRTGQPNADVIGGSRLLRLTLDANPNRYNRAARARVSPSLGSLLIGNQPRVESTTSLLWDANGLGLDAVGQGNFLDRVGTSAAFQLDFKTIVSSTGIDVTITVGDTTANSASYTVTGLKGDTTYDQFLISKFVGVDFNNINYIQLVIDGPAGFSADLNSFEMYEIPEPSALGGSILAIGLTLTCLKRKRDEPEGDNR